MNVSDTPSVLQDRIASVVFGFDDPDRKEAIRHLAREVGSVERELTAALARADALQAELLNEKEQLSIALACKRIAEKEVTSLDKWVATLREKRDALLAERDALRAERDALKRQVDVAINTMGAANGAIEDTAPDTIWMPGFTQTTCDFLQDAINQITKALSEARKETT